MAALTLDYGNIVENAYLHLRQHNIVQSQYDFSRNFLERSPGYYGYIKSSGSVPSANTVLALLNQCGQRRRMWKDAAQSSKLSPLALNLFKNQAMAIGQIGDQVLKFISYSEIN